VRQGVAAVNRAFELQPGPWHGPLRSERGVHFVRVVEHHPPVLPSFSELESYLRQDWMLDQQRRALADQLAELRRNYRIVVEQAP
jgi:peptidyl-prolyl cis-trans isomerase C